MALVRRLIGDAQAKLRKMVDDNLQVTTRADCDLSIDRTEAADPLITPATDSSVSLSLADGICRPPSGSPSRPPSSHNDRSKFYSAPYLDSDKKAALALDRKINFNSSLSNSNDQKTLGKNGSLEKSMNGNDAHYSVDSMPGTSRSTRLSLSNKQISRTSYADRSSCSAINEIENEHLMDGFDAVDNEYPMNGMLGSPALNHQNGGDRASYAEIVVPISKYADRNILDAESSEADDDIAPSENGSGTSPRATETGTQENDDTSGRSGSGREGSVPAGDESDRRGLGSGSCGGSVGGLSPAPASPRAITAADAARRLRHENERLKGEAARLRRLLVAAAERGEAGAALLAGNNATTPDPPPPEGSEAARIRTLEAELKMAREAVIALKADRKRLKAEKFDLLNQMKQLYASLEDKERELRDFIRNYEQMRASSGSSRRAEEREMLVQRARDEAERCLALAARLSARELQLQHARDQLHEARRQLQAGGWVSDQESLGSLPRQGGGALTPGGSASGGLLGPTLGLALAAGDRGSCSADSGVRVTGSSDRESGATSIGGNLSDSTTDGTPTITLGGDGLDMDSISVVSSIQQAHLYHLPVTTPKDCSPTLSPHNSNPFSRSIESSVLSRSVEQLSGLGEREVVAPRMRGRSAVGGGGPGGAVGTGARSGRGPSAWGSISRVFARSRHRNKPPSVGPHDCESLYDCRGSWVGQNMGPSSGPGAEAALREAASLPLERWRAPAVRAWLDIALGMPPQYGAKCAENIKSGKVLLELTDSELETGLGIVHPMHRKKLRLAIEEHRNPDMVRHPAITQLGHDWVASEWLPDLGLSQYAENFAANMVDARMLDNLSKKELEKYLGVTRKFHQASIVHGIHLLRLMKYDRQALALRRHQCETIDADPLVWTNQRFMRWARNIDLAEYADNLKDSGVHGGLVVLEPSFTGDTMATALGVPPARAIIRRHLAQQLDALVLPARNSLGALPARRIRASSGFGTMSSGSSGRAHWRSLAGLEVADLAAKNIKGSITRALGLKPKQEKTSPSSSSESSSIMSRWGKPSPPRTRSHLSIGHPSIGRPSSSLDYDDSAICIYESPQSLYDSPSSCYNPSHLSFRVSSQQSINSNIYSNGSQCFDIAELSGVSHRTYSQRSVNSHRVSSPLPIHEEVENSFKQKRHRRVRSIGDIEAAATLPV